MLVWNPPLYGSVISLFLCFPLHAAGEDRIKFVKDINQEAVEVSTGTREMAILRKKAYFSNFDERYGSELWASDGTRAGTRIVADISPGQDSGGPHDFMTMGGNLYFSAYTPANGSELWRSNGTKKGTGLIKDITNFREGGAPDLLGASSSKLWFSATSGSVGGGIYQALWVTDGTTSGTFELHPIDDWWASPQPGRLRGINALGVAGETAFMAAGGCEIWKSNGLAGGTVLVKKLSDNPNAGISSFITTRDRWFAVVDDDSPNCKLWSGGAEPGQAISLAQIGSRHVHRWGDRAVYAGAGNHFMHITDGTREGTALLEGNHYFHPTVIDAGPQMYFVGGNRQLWKTNGTGPGTLKVFDFPDGVPGMLVQDPIATKRGVFYVGDDGVHGRELWVTNGSESGTRMVRDVLPGPRSANPIPLGSANSRFFFSDVDFNQRTSVWTTNGTTKGTRSLIKKPVWNYGSIDGSLADSAEVGKFVFFAADDGIHGSELWVSDGTADGTRMVQDINEGYFVSNPEGLIALGDGVIFTIRSNWVETRSLWFAGTAEGSALPLNLGEGEEFVRPVSVVSKGVAYFGVAAKYHDCRLWQTDGTQNGTVPVAGTEDIKLPTYGDRPLMVEWGGGVCFWGAEEGGACKLWHLKDGEKRALAELGLSAIPAYLTAVGDRLAYFVYPASGQGFELWETDDSGVARKLSEGFYDITFSGTAGGKHCFMAADSEGAVTWWKSDGTSAGTSVLKFIGEGEIGFSRFALPDPIQAGSLVYFAAWDAVNGSELWQTDGTEAGTRLVADIVPGSGGSDPRGFVFAREKLYFTASDAEHGRDLWCSDGTAGGTVRIPREGIPGDSMPTVLMPGNGMLLLGATVPYKGSELHVLEFEEGQERR